MGNLSPHQLLVRIDMKDDPDQCGKEFEGLFNKYDADKSGVLEGEEFEKLCTDVGDYVIDEMKTKMKDEDIYLDPANLTAIREWIKSTFDPDSTGKCSLETVKAKLKSLVDECDYSEGK